MHSFTNFLLHKRCPYSDFFLIRILPHWDQKNSKYRHFLHSVCALTFKSFLLSFFFQSLIFKNQQKVVPAKTFLPLCSEVWITTFERFSFYISLFRSGHTRKFFIRFYSFSHFLKNYSFSHLLPPLLLYKNTSVTTNSRNRRFESVSNNFKTYNWGQN